MSGYLKLNYLNINTNMLSMKIDDSEGTADGALGGKGKSENPHAGELGTDRDLTPCLTRVDYLGVKVPYCYRSGVSWK